MLAVKCETGAHKTERIIKKVGVCTWTVDAYPYVSQPDRLIRVSLCCN